MKKCKRFIASLLVCLTLVGLLAIAAFATPSKPYSSMSLSVSVVHGEKDVATASIRRCTETPVDNHLSTLLRVQYKDGNNYYWDPIQEGMYYVQKGDDVDQVSVQVERNYIYYAKAIFYARCKTGSQQTYYRYWNR